METHGTVGVYCLANDTVLDWFIALCESLRSVEPAIPLVVIPFDEAVEKLSKLRGRYGFSFIDDRSLDDLDRIGATLYPENHAAAHLHRKFAVFWGPFDHFLFLDSDIVVVSELHSVLSGYLSSPCRFLYFDRDLDQVYRPGAFRDRMARAYASKGFNTGAFVSSKGMLTIDDVRAAAVAAVSLVKNFAPTGEQPFFNYCVDTKRLSVLRAADVLPGRPMAAWGGLTPPKRVEREKRLMDRRSGDVSKRVLLIHWAGVPCDLAMPNRGIFMSYRLKGRPPLARLAFALTFHPFMKRLTPAPLFRKLYRRLPRGSTANA